MREVWKYEVPVDDEVHAIDIPQERPVLHVDSQTPALVAFWVEVDMDELADTRLRTRYFRVVGTGHPIVDDEWEYRGTAVVLNGVLVWHLLERVE